MRIERRLTIDELAARLVLPRTTIYYWCATCRSRVRGPAVCGTRPRGARGHGRCTGSTACCGGRLIGLVSGSSMCLRASRRSGTSCVCTWRRGTSDGGMLSPAATRTQPSCDSRTFRWVVSPTVRACFRSTIMPIKTCGNCANAGALACRSTRTRSDSRASQTATSSPAGPIAPAMGYSRSACTTRSSVPESRLGWIDCTPNGTRLGHRIGAWRSLVARGLWVAEVPSSNLGAPIFAFSCVAQKP